MTIQKKSLISSLNTTQKAIVASSTPAENPSVSSPVSARKAPAHAARKAPAHAARKAPAHISRKKKG